MRLLVQAHTEAGAALVIWLGLSLVTVPLAASCTLSPALASATGAEVGLIMIPGANIPGERYLALATKIQEELADKASVWVGITKSWLGNFPNPLEISGALSDCLSQAAAEGLGGPVYMAGHSLGGIMLETYIKVTSPSTTTT